MSPTSLSPNKDSPIKKEVYLSSFSNSIIFKSFCVKNIKPAPRKNKNKKPIPIVDFILLIFSKSFQTETYEFVMTQERQKCQT